MPTRKVPPQEKRCQQRREDGKQCRAARLRGFQYCLFHHPWTQKHRAKFDKIEELQLKDSSEIHELLVGAVREVGAGNMNAQQAYALGWLVRLLRENLTGVEEERTLCQKEGLAVEKEPEFGEAVEASAEKGTEETAGGEAEEGRSAQLEEE